LGLNLEVLLRDLKEEKLLQLDCVHLEASFAPAKRRGYAQVAIIYDGASCGIYLFLVFQKSSQQTPLYFSMDKTAVEKTKNFLWTKEAWFIFWCPSATKVTLIVWICFR
jgi:hypothetical protein